MALHNERRPLEKKIMLFEPRIFSDVKAIAGKLLAGQAAVVNFQRIDDEQAHRVVDFLSGVVLQSMVRSNASVNRSFYVLRMILKLRAT